MTDSTKYKACEYESLFTKNVLMIKQGWQRSFEVLKHKKLKDD